MSSTPNASAAGPSRQQKMGTHQAAHSIRAKAASSHTGQHDKGKGRDAGLTGNSKVVYKALLESPLAVKWPSLPTHLQQTIVHTLCGLLTGVADYHLRLGRVTSKPRPIDLKKSRRRGDKPEHRAVERTAEERKAIFVAKHARPPVLDHVVLGINEISKELSNPTASTFKAHTAPPRAAAHSAQTDPPAASTSTSSRSPASPLKYIFVCLADINPTSLVAHLPAATAGWNGRAKAAGQDDASGTRLVTLAKGAEALLAQAFGIRRAAVVGIRASCPPDLIGQLDTLLPTSVLPPLLVAHLVPPAFLPPKPAFKPAPPPPATMTTTSKLPAFLPTHPGAATAGPSRPPPAKARLKPAKAQTPAKRALAPMRVKMVKTTMPRDMKAAKAERAKAVAERRKAHKAVKKALAKKGAKAAQSGLSAARGGKGQKSGGAQR